MNAVKSAFKLISPSFYAAQYRGLIASTSKQIQAGSPAPLFKSLLAVGLIGYAIEYGLVGSKSCLNTKVIPMKNNWNSMIISGHHVADKQAVVKKALEGHHH